MRRSNVGWIAIGLAFVVVVSFAAEGGFATGHKRESDHAAPMIGTHGSALTRHRLLVGLAPGATVADLARELQRANGQVLDRIGALGVVELRVPPGRLHSASRALGSLDSVLYVEREGRAQATATPNDPYYPWSGSNVILGGQWGHGLTQAPKAWDITTGSSNVIVADVDSGIDTAHPDLAGQVVAGTSVLGGSTTDTDGHGEYVAGVISAKTNNAIGGAGYCWSCKLMPVKITNGGSATYSDMASGIVWAADHGARVINVSYAGTSSSSTLNSAVSYATNHGAVVVAAAGNSGCNCASYPAASPGAIAVAASDQQDNLMNYSNWGSWVQVAAPTGDITTWLTNPKTGGPYGYGPVGGTSISAPVVSGVVALMLSFDPAATPAQIKDALYASVDPVTGLTQGGAAVTVQYGRVNAYKALLAVGASPLLPSPSPSAQPSPTTAPSPSPSPTQSSSSTSSPRPSESPSPTSSSPPVPQVFTFSGNLNRNNPSRTFSLTLPTSSTAEALLSFKRCPTLDLTMRDAGNAAVGETFGPSVVSLSESVEAGAYSYIVNGGLCSFTLTVTVTP